MSLANEDANTVREILYHNYFHMLAIAFLYFDHIITIGDEVQYCWSRPKTKSSYWFFLNRYFACLSNISVTALAFTTLSSQSCRQYNLYRQLLLIVTQVLVCVILTLRIYALYECQLRILAFMVGSGAVLIAVACWALFSQKSDHGPEASGCHIGLSRETAIRLAGGWEALFVYDSIVFSMTLYRTWQARHHFVQGTLPNLVALILRDGAIYFAVMALANLTNILTFYFAGPFMRGGLSTFASSISVTMASRLMLNLHRTANQGIFSTYLTTTTEASYNRNEDISYELDTLRTEELILRSRDPPSPPDAEGGTRS